MMKQSFIVAFATVLLLTGASGATYASPQPPSSMKESDEQLETAFDRHYRSGYELGFEQGWRDRNSNQKYAPQQLTNSLNLESFPDQRAKAGYLAGVLAGFHDGYYNHSEENQAEIQRFYEGYNQGYQSGEEDAQTVRQTAKTYTPQPDSSNPSDPQFTNGYNIGYWQGFEAGWSSNQ
ncbi:hypothetical protein PN462_14575 [Spirulina sp. CS-785/01]|uniref:hypothetical protein n=1 Tax=Spirulina sp. CS-785/01 TaxID=3021716 RepID=UPI00232D8FF7|nr:hypothetical protein [Spirulina sp. CS-785/01]MDB9314335.1 hypothetical protein [Spirulina sp. CS-785/01]